VGGLTLSEDNWPSYALGRPDSHSSPWPCHELQQMFRTVLEPHTTLLMPLGGLTGSVLAFYGLTGSANCRPSYL